MALSAQYLQKLVGGKGSAILTKEIEHRARRYAEKLRDLLYEGIHQYIDSFEKKTIKIGRVKIVGTEAEIVLGLSENDLWRDSLTLHETDNGSTIKGGYGVKNIVLLFETGYHASSEVQGYWHGGWTHSLMDREGVDMLAPAIYTFNQLFAKEGVTAELVGDYDIQGR